MVSFNESPTASTEASRTRIQRERSNQFEILLKKVCLNVRIWSIEYKGYVLSETFPAYFCLIAPCICVCL